jgi:chromosome segregation ATPase
MIIRWVSNLEEAAKARAVAQDRLNKPNLSTDDERQLSEEISKRNEEIETYARRINDDLKRAASERLKVELSGNIDSIRDGQLDGYLKSVRTTIDSLNEQINAEGRSAERYAVSVREKRVQAEKLDEVSKKNQQTLARDEAKLTDALKDAEKRLDNREDDQRKVDLELRRLESERKKFGMEYDRVKDFQADQQKQQTKMSRDADDLDKRIKSERVRERRDQLRDQLDRFQPQLDQQKKLLDQLAFQLGQLDRIRDKLDLEKEQLTAAAGSAKADIQSMKAEIAEFKKTRQAIRDNIAKEGKRREALAACIADCQQAEARAKEFGVLAKR